MIKTPIKSFLWVVPAWPFPPGDGAAIARANLIGSLLECGYEIDILVLSNSLLSDFEIPENFPIGRVYCIKTNTEHRFLKPFYYALMSLLDWYTPVVMLRFGGRKVRSAIDTMLDETGRKWDAIVYDGLHVAAHQMHVGKYQRTALPVVIYRAHNVESDIWFRMAEQEKNSLLRLFLRMQAKRVARFENSLVEKADCVATVSSADFLKLNQQVPQILGGVVPISFTFDQPFQFPEPAEKIHLMFLGRLDWLPNKEGLVWFLKNVWPKVIQSRNDLHLTIAGSGDSGWMSHYSSLPHVSFLGKIQDIEQLYQQSCLVIVPIFYGSGTRVKIIEACRYGRPCLSTKLGAEGVGLENLDSYYCADDVESWVSCLVNLQPELLKNIGDNAFNKTKSVFDHGVAREEFIKLLRAVETGHPVLHTTPPDLTDQSPI